MGKIIIENRTEESDLSALFRVSVVMQSKDNLDDECLWSYPDGINVASFINKRSVRFVVYRNSPTEKGSDE